MPCSRVGVKSFSGFVLVKTVHQLQQPSLAVLLTAECKYDFLCEIQASAFNPTTILDLKTIVPFTLLIGLIRLAKSRVQTLGYLTLKHKAVT